MRNDQLYFSCNAPVASRQPVRCKKSAGLSGCENDSEIVVDLLSVLRIASTVSTKLPALALMTFGAIGGLLATFQIATSSLFH